MSPAGQEITDADCRRYGMGPYASAQDATTGDTGVEEAETTTGTDTEPEGPQTGLQDDESEESPDETQKPAPSAGPRRKK